MRNWQKTIATVVICLHASVSFADPPVAYEVSANLTHAGKSFAAPNAVVRANRPASVEVSGPDGYTFMLTVTDLAPDQIQVAVQVDSSYGAMAPTVVVRPGETANVSMGELGLELTVRRSGG